MQIQVTQERRPERCLYCHDSLGSAFFTCDNCGAAYHRECTTRCVNMGCQGAVHLDPVERTAGERRYSRFARLVLAATFVLPCVFVTIATGFWRALLAVDPVAVGVMALYLATPIAFLMLRDSMRSVRRARAAASPRIVLTLKAVTPDAAPSSPPPIQATVAPVTAAQDMTHAAPPTIADPAPDPGALQMPTMFAAHPIAMEGKVSADDIERAHHQHEARRDRLRPPGLGKTI